MEFTDTDKPVAEADEIKKIESAQDFDQLYQMDHLKLSETISTLAGETAAPSSSQYDPSKIMAGSTYPRAGSQKGQKPPSHTFSECDTSSFSLRVGPNYAKTGAKAPGGPSLYDVVGME